MSDDQTPDLTLAEPQEAAEAPETAVQPLVLLSGPTNIEMALRGRIGEALRQPMLPGDLEYMLTPLVMPSQQGPMPGAALTLAIPTGLLDKSRAQCTVVLPSLWMSTEDLSSIVRDACESLQQARSQALAQGSQPPGDGLNGHERLG